MFMTSCKPNNVITIKKEFNSLEYYDGKKSTKDFLLGNNYWLGASSYIDFRTANVKFLNEKDTVSLNLFPEKTKDFTVRKYLSTFQPDHRGFYKKDLFLISKALKLPEPVIKNDIYYIKDKYSYHLVYEEYKGKHYFMIYSITGGRMPEGIIVYKVYEVAFNENMKNKYFNKKT